MEKTFIYQGLPIRTFIRDGEVWMHANDIGRALGFKRGVKAVVYRLGVENVNEMPAKDKQGHIQPAYVLRESDMKPLVEKVDPEQTAPFILWYTKEIVPYIHDCKSAIVSADTKIRQLEAKNRNFYPDFVKGHAVYLTTAEIASDYNKSERWMTAVLLKLGFLKRSKKGRIVVDNRKYPSPSYWLEWMDDGEYCYKWSSKGVMAIRDAMNELGYKTKYEA